MTPSPPEARPRSAFLAGLAVARDAGRVSPEFYRQVEAMEVELRELQEALRQIRDEALSLTEAKAMAALAASSEEPG